jgi:predicted permease
MSLWSRVANVFRSGRLHRELDEELQFHLEERTRELVAAGMARDAAVREAARRLGSPLRLREQSLDVKRMLWLDSLGRDVRLGVRMLRRHGAVTGAAVISLSLALGACVAAFSLVDALILRPIPVRQPDRLVYLAFSTYTPERPEADTFNDPLFLRLRAAARGRVDLFAMSTQVMRQVRFAGSSGEQERVRTQFASGDAFEQLGIRPFAGRLLTRRDDVTPGSHPVAVISHAFWTRRFGGDPAAIGRSFTLAGDSRLGDDRPFEIIGIAESGFGGVEPGRPTDLWLPYAMYNPRAFGNAEFGWFRIFGRLGDGVRVEEAESVLQAAFTGFRRDRMSVSAALGPGRPAEDIARYLNTPIYARAAVTGASPLRRQFERPLWVLAAIASLVLLIAGSNVANLFLARTAAREREMALRLSIGAGRGRLIQQVLVESALVAIGVCVLGLLVAAVAAPSVVTMLTTPDDPVRLDLRLDRRVMAFAAALVVLLTALLGILPALRASGVAPIGALKTGGSRTAARTSVMRPFVALQVAFGLAVLFGGGLLVLSFARLSRVDPGFATSRVLLVSLEPVRRVDPGEQRLALWRVIDRLRAVPGVEAASSAEFNALGRAWTHFVPVAGTTARIEATMSPVTDGFFETMRIPIVAGRAFAADDVRGGRAAPIVVNETFAARYLGGAPAVGRTVTARFGGTDDSDTHEIVGVAADTRYDLRQPAAPTVYIPLTLRSSGTLHVRVAGEGPAAARIRDEIRAADPLFRVTAIGSQAEAVARTMIRERLLALLSGFFAIVGLVLAAVGLYGVLSYSVMQRTREIGIRVALGARRSGVVGMVLADAGRTTLLGAAAGVAAGLYLSRFLETLLFEVTPLDFWSLALPVGTLLLTALLASALPALQASRVDPAVALRDE